MKGKNSIRLWIDCLKDLSGPLGDGHDVVVDGAAVGPPRRHLRVQGGVGPVDDRDRHGKKIARLTDPPRMSFVYLGRSRD